MDRELIIDSNSSGVDIALLEDKYLVELHKEKNNKQYSVGDVYLGKVKKLMPGLNAAFVNVGYEKDAFLHYLDLGPQVRSLNKYAKLAMTGKASQIPISEFRLEPEMILKKPVKFLTSFQLISKSWCKLPRNPFRRKARELLPRFHSPGVISCWCLLPTGFRFPKKSGVTTSASD